jgi:hypothetical protein
MALFVEPGFVDEGFFADPVTPVAGPFTLGSDEPPRYFLEIEPAPEMEAA